MLFAVVFFWTPPHFWALAIRYREDYARAGVPMLPVVATPVRWRARSSSTRWLTVAASLVLWPLATGWVYGVLALAPARRCWSRRTGCWLATVPGSHGKPMRLFHLSNSYLAFVFLAVAVDTFLR